MFTSLAAQERFFQGRDLVEKFANAEAASIELLGAGDGRFAARVGELRRAREAGVVMLTVCVRWTTSSATSTPGAAPTHARS
jgi:hypothetical protein